MFSRKTGEHKFSSVFFFLFQIWPDGWPIFSRTVCYIGDLFGATPVWTLWRFYIFATLFIKDWNSKVEFPQNSKTGVRASWIFIYKFFNWECCPFPCYVIFSIFIDHSLLSIVHFQHIFHVSYIYYIAHLVSFTKKQLRIFLFVCAGQTLQETQTKQCKFWSFPLIMLMKQHLLNILGLT